MRSIGPRPTPSVRAATRTPTLLAIAIAITIGCGSEPSRDPAPLDRFTFPVGLALHGEDLLVVSSNFDLAFASDDGGSLLRVTLGGATPVIQPDGVRIGSFGGEVAVVDPASCPAIVQGAKALVTSRFADRLYQVGLDGNLSCGAGCEVPFGFDGRLGDPYGVGVTCVGSATGGDGRARAWVGFLRTPLHDGLVAEVDLLNPASTPTVFSMGTGNVQSFAYDAETGRLFMTGVNTGLSAPLRWIEQAGTCDPSKASTAGGCVIRSFDLWQLLRGAELSGIALSNPIPGLPRRVYLTARLYDADLATTLGSRPGSDTGGVLLVLELEEGANGELQPRLVSDPVKIGFGVGPVRVLPLRPGGLRDLVAVTAADDGELTVYDDEAGLVRDVFGRDPATGVPVVGRAPFGLAVQDLRSTPGTGDGDARVFVGAFTDGFVSAVDVPLSGSAAAKLVPAADGKTPLRIGVTP